MDYKRVRNALRAGLLQNGFGALAMADQLIPFYRHPLAGVARAVHMNPLPFALAGIERLRGVKFVCYRHDQVLLFREWKRFERTKNTGLVHDLQLPDHSLIVPWSMLALAAGTVLFVCLLLYANRSDSFTRL